MGNDAVIEFELGLKALLSCRNELQRDAKNDIEKDVNLRTATNRLFITVEHFANTLVLLEYGSFSTKHMKDMEKYSSIEEKYSVGFNLKDLYIKSWDLRSFADYGTDRKTAEFKHETVSSLSKQAISLMHIVSNALDSRKISITELKEIMDMISQPRTAPSQ